MKIISYNPGHDGAIAYLEDGVLKFSVEAEKDSNYRYSPISSNDVFKVLGELDGIPDILSVGGWWPRESEQLGRKLFVGYRGTERNGIFVEERKLFGKPIDFFSSSHERSHILCAYGMSDLPIGSPCYALLWEGEIGAFYEIDSKLNITLLANVLTQPGNRYASVYGLADPSFPKNAPFSRFSDAGKVMALASYSSRKPLSSEDDGLVDFLLHSEHLQLNLYQGLEKSRYYNVGVEDPEFCNFAGIFSDRIFDAFYNYAKSNMHKELPLVIGGGCGLNCDWNSKWKQSGLFSDVYVPPVVNDSGSAIGTAIDAQFYFTGNPKIEWNVYAGLPFDSDNFSNKDAYDIYEESDIAANLLANDLILGWVSGKYEIGPRALGNRSILAAPFKESTRVRLNQIKQREQFRPIAPVCLEEDAAKWFDCDLPSPHMLYTFKVRSENLLAVTHVNKTARLQTVSRSSNRTLYNLLSDFKSITGFGVLCNTSLNFNGRGFINNINDLSEYVVNHKLDGFVMEGKSYILKSSEKYQKFLRKK